jgi:hypothetical protein
MPLQIRVGIPIDRAYGVEDLLYKYGVDVHFQAHEHSYERMWPVYNLTVRSLSSNEWTESRHLDKYLSTARML